MGPSGFSDQISRRLQIKDSHLEIPVLWEKDPVSCLHHNPCQSGLPLRLQVQWLRHDHPNPSTQNPGEGQDDSCGHRVFQTVPPGTEGTYGSLPNDLVCWAGNIPTGNPLAVTVQ